MGHILGLRHEQARTDRDEFITVDRDVILDSIDPGTQQDSYLGDEVVRGATAGSYDYLSVMQYDNRQVDGAWFYDSTTYFPTAEIGAGDGLSEDDHDAVFRLYGDPAAQPRVTGQIDTTETSLTSLTLNGSAVDPENPERPVTISTLIDGEVVDTAHISGVPAFTVTTSVPEGRHTVCLRGAPDPAGGIRHTTLGCTVVTTKSSAGDLETVEPLRTVSASKAG